MFVIYRYFDFAPEEYSLPKLESLPYSLSREKGMRSMIYVSVVVSSVALVKGFQVNYVKSPKLSSSPISFGRSWMVIDTKCRSSPSELVESHPGEENDDFSFHQEEVDIASLLHPASSGDDYPGESKEIFGIGQPSREMTRSDLQVVEKTYGEDLDSDEVYPTSSVGDILRFAIPAVGVWLCSPLLSLIDTSAVGLFSGTFDQAALNPATTITDYSALLLAFVYTATTNLASTARSRDEKYKSDKQVAPQTLVSALNFAAFVGTGLGVLLLLSSQPLLRVIMGSNIDSKVFSPATRYLCIRKFIAGIIVSISQRLISKHFINIRRTWYASSSDYRNCAISLFRNERYQDSACSTFGRSCDKSFG